ncbi:MAG: 2-polyprenylphenol 6-hydroxylase [Rickettsiales bacterium]|nr:2-polyprenylphenol 6-hydroxylase [Rickettsiales bacterium]
MLRHLRNSFRLLRVGWVLARNDALFPLQETRFAPATTLLCKLFRKRRNSLRQGERLAEALQKLGPSYVKLGQSLSTRSDIIGDEIAKDLADLRDGLPPFPMAQVRGIIEAEFEKPLEDVYASFDETPIAAASIAQVHFATTHEGDEVAVKVIRPNIRADFARDIELFEWIASLLDGRAELVRFKPAKVVETFAESVKMELDLRFEGSSAAELRDNMKHDAEFYVPKVYWAQTSGRVLTLERINGTKISDLETLKAKGHDFQKLVKIAAEGFFNQVFRDGYFHADLHPGNLFVLDDGRVAAVDFGIMGRVNWQERIYIAQILKGFLEGDYHKVARMHFDAGYVPAHKNADHFATAARAIGEPILGLPLDQISVANLLEQLFQVAADFEMQTQPQLLLLQKTMMVAEGVGRMLVPNVNMWKLAEPLVMEWVALNFGPKAQIKNITEHVGNIAERLPAAIKHAENLLQKVDSGGLKLHPDTVKALLAERRHSHNQWLLLAWAGLIGFGLLLYSN